MLTRELFGTICGQTTISFFRQSKLESSLSIVHLLQTSSHPQIQPLPQHPKRFGQSINLRRMAQVGHAIKNQGGQRELFLRAMHTSFFDLQKNSR